VPSVSYVAVAFPPIVVLILVAVFGPFVATRATKRRARYRQRLEDAYWRFDRYGSAHDTEATARGTGDHRPSFAHAFEEHQYPMLREPRHARPGPAEQPFATLSGSSVK
jgi:hypothetical protein